MHRRERPPRSLHIPEVPQLPNVRQCQRGRQSAAVCGATHCTILDLGLPRSGERLTKVVGRSRKNGRHVHGTHYTNAFGV